MDDSGWDDKWPLACCSVACQTGYSQPCYPQLTTSLKSQIAKAATGPHASKSVHPWLFAEHVIRLAQAGIPTAQLLTTPAC